jgi:hypothetical protein
MDTRHRDLRHWVGVGRSESELVTLSVDAGGL